MVAGVADGKRDDSDCSTRGVSAGAILVKATGSVARHGYRIDVVMLPDLACCNMLASVARYEAVQPRATGTPTTAIELDGNDSFG